MTSPSAISPTETNATEHTARYEALRRNVLESHRPTEAGDGLAVLLRRGLAAWMDAWSKLPAAPPMRAAQDERQRQPLPDGTSTEVIHVLAAMALEHIQEVHV